MPASSFHLYWNNLPVTAFNEASVIFRAIQKPALTADLVYHAMQVSFRQVDGTTRGGAHTGLQSSYTNNNVTKTSVNWGGYDDIVGAGATFRGSFPTLPVQGTNYTSPLFAWYPDRDYQFRVFKSPKQNYLAAELTAGGDQVAGEIAWRATVTDLSTGVVTIIRDLLVPNCNTVSGMNAPVMWSEDFNTLSAPVATEPWDIRWSEPRVDGRLSSQVQINYPDVLTNTMTDGTDHIGYRQKSVVTRTNVNNDLINHPGPVFRFVSYDAVGTDPSRATVVLPVPSATLSGELLIAVIGNHASNGPPTAPAGWTQLFTDTDDNVNDIRMTAFYRYHDTAIASHTFTNPSSSNNLAGVLVSWFGADLSTPPSWGPLGISLEGASTWAVPAMTKNTNYGRVLVVVATAPQSTSVQTIWPGNVLKVVDSRDDMPDWTQIAIGEEIVPLPIGTAAAKSGSMSAGCWQTIGKQMMLYPPLQRLRPGSDVSNTGWTVAPLWSKINETVVDDTNFISAPTTSVCVVALSVGGLVDPGIDDGHVVRYRVRRQDSSGASVLVELLQTTTVISSKTETVLAGNAFVDGVLNLTNAETATITDYTALRLRFTATVT